MESEEISTKRVLNKLCCICKPSVIQITENLSLIHYVITHIENIHNNKNINKTFGEDIRRTTMGTKHEFEKITIMMHHDDCMHLINITTLVHYVYYYHSTKCT